MNNYSIRRVIEKKDHGSMLRDYLYDELKFSQRLVKKVKSPLGNIRVNGEKKTVRYMFQEGDRLEIEFPPEKISDYIQPEKMALEIVFEDEYLMIVNKPTGIATVPSRLHRTGTLANAIAYYYEKRNIPFTIHIVTRLDKDTSGLVLIAKHQYSHSLLSDLQRENKIRRTYRAIVHGNLKRKKGTINSPIGRKPDSIIERMVKNDGKRAVTHYEVVQEMKRYSYVQIELETGRTHQIRVHFSSIGHPLVGDDLYGGETGTILRQALYCFEISFIHPFTKQYIQRNCNEPDDFARLLS